MNVAARARRGAHVLERDRGDNAASTGATSGSDRARTRLAPVQHGRVQRSSSLTNIGCTQFSNAQFSHDGASHDFKRGDGQYSRWPHWQLLPCWRATRIGKLCGATISTISRFHGAWPPRRARASSASAARLRAILRCAPRGRLRARRRHRRCRVVPAGPHDARPAAAAARAGAASACVATPQSAAADATALFAVSSAVDAAEYANSADSAATATAFLQYDSDLAVNVARFWQHSSF